MQASIRADPSSLLIGWKGSGGRSSPNSQQVLQVSSAYALVRVLHVPMVNNKVNGLQTKAPPFTAGGRSLGWCDAACVHCEQDEQQWG